LANRRQVVEAAHGHLHLVADAVAVQQHLGWILLQQGAGQLAYHCGPSCHFAHTAKNCASGACGASPFFGIISVILRHTFTPHNNTRLSHLCAPPDSHLRTIEAALQVSIAHRHEQFKVDGPKARATQAMEMLQAVYEIADRPISEDTLQLMLAGDS